MGALTGLSGLSGISGIAGISEGLTVPTASSNPPVLTVGFVGNLEIEVIYQGPDPIDVSTFDVNDITVVGPNGYSENATFVSSVPASNAPFVTATYSIPPPLGAWDETDNGVYTISIEPNAVADDQGVFIAAGIIGQLTVNITTQLLYSLDFSSGRNSLYLGTPGAY